MYLLNGECITEGLVYKAEVEDKEGQNKVYFGCTEGSFNKRCYKHQSSFRLQFTSIVQNWHMWELKVKYSKISNVYWSIFKNAKPYSIGNAMCRLWQKEKLAVMSYLGPDNLLNNRIMRLYQVQKHVKKYLLEKSGQKLYIVFYFIPSFPPLSSNIFSLS